MNEKSVIIRKIYRGVAQPGSAPALGAGSRRFKSSRPDQTVISSISQSPSINKDFRLKSRHAKKITISRSRAGAREPGKKQHQKCKPGLKDVRIVCPKISACIDLKQAYLISGWHWLKPLLSGHLHQNFEPLKKSNSYVHNLLICLTSKSYQILIQSPFRPALESLIQNYLFAIFIS